MRNIITLILVISISIFGIVGCSNNDKSNPNESTIKQSDNSNDLSMTIKKYIESKKTNSNISNLQVGLSHDIGQGMLVMFTYEENNISFEGLCQITENQNKYDVVTEDHTKIDKTVPFTVHQMSGTYTDSQSLKKSYIIVGGVVENKNIKEMNINFNNGLFIDLKLGDGNTYSYAKTDKETSIKKITALDEKGNEIFEYPPYPPKKMN